MRSIDKIIIHCSATVEGRHFTVEDIDRWHKQRGFRCIGYHFVIYLDGSVHNGRPIEEVGAHCLNHNAHSIGICYIGGLDEAKKPKDTRTPQQKDALKRLVQKLLNDYPNAKVHGHNELACVRTKREPGFSTSQCQDNCAKCNYAGRPCPCFDVRAEF